MQRKCEPSYNPCQCMSANEFPRFSGSRAVIPTITSDVRPQSVRSIKYTMTTTDDSRDDMIPPMRVGRQTRTELEIQRQTQETLLSLIFSHEWTRRTEDGVMFTEERCQHVTVSSNNAQLILNLRRREAHDKGLGRSLGFPRIGVSGRLLEMRTIPGK